MIKLIGPTNISSLSIAGTAYDVVNGAVSVKPEHVADAKDMGFSVAPDVEDDPNFVPSDDIASMNRNELFAWLKAKGIAVSPPITNDALRAIVRENSGDPDADKKAADAKAASEKAAADLAVAEKAAADKAATDAKALADKQAADKAASDKAAADKKAADDAAAALAAKTEPTT